MTNHLPHSLSLRIKSLGFDRPVRDYYTLATTLITTTRAENHNEILSHIVAVSAPTYSEFFAWCREEKGIDSWVQPLSDGKRKEYAGFWMSADSDGGLILTYPTHPAAEQALAEKLVELIEQTKTEGK